MAENNTILAISDFDPAGSSGLSADVKTFASFRLFSNGVVTSIVTGDAKRTRSIHAIPLEDLQNQFSSIPGQPAIAAVKVGALVNSEQVREVSRFIRDRKIDRVVIDPILRTAAGQDLCGADGIETLRQEMFPLSEIVAPTAEVAGLLTGIPADTTETMKQAAVMMRNMGARFVVVTGTDPSGEILHLLCSKEGFTTYRTEGYPAGSMRSAHYAFTGALAAQRCVGTEIAEAVDVASRFAREAVLQAPHLVESAGTVDTSVPLD